MVHWVYILLTYDTPNKAAIMFLRKFVLPFYDMTVMFTFHHRMYKLVVSRPMSVETLLAFKKPITVFAKHPVRNWTVLCIA